MIQISSLIKYYENRKVLDVSVLKLERGKLYILYGPNGSGKTTLLRILAGLEKADSGKIDGKVEPHSIIMCFHKPYMYRGSVLFNIKLGLKWHKRNPLKGEVRQIIEKLDLSGLKRRDAKTLSAGESLRVSLARALILKPELLLLDEPAASLDTESVEKIEKLLSEYVKEGNTVLMASHIAEQGKRMKAQLIHLEEGRLIEKK